MTTRGTGDEPTLEQRVEKLEQTTQKLQRDQSATRRLVRDLKRQVDTILPSVKSELVDQTREITTHVDEELAAHRQFVLETIVDVARQWPASAVVIATIVGGAAAAAVVDLLLAAAHLPHLS
jgi:hypothetical protein